MEDEWAEYAPTWDTDPGARLYAGGAFGSLAEVLGEVGLTLDGARVLDFGCGTGLLTERLVDEGASVHAVDTSAAMIEVLDAKIAERGWTNVTTGSDLSETPERFDLVVCSSVCSFLDDYPATAQELAALLSSGGLFVQWDWERLPGEADGHGLTRDEIGAALDAAGLEGIAVETGFSVEFEGETMAPLMGYATRR